MPAATLTNQRLDWIDALVLLGVLAASLLTLRGITLALRGVLQPGQTRSQILHRIEGFRIFVVGLAGLGLAIGWMTGAAWLMVIAFAVGAEELLESSVIIAAMRQDAR